MANTYLKGKLAPHEREAHHHVMPVKLYLQVFAALLVATGLTVLVSYADLGSAALPIAMFVAVVKSALVIGYFMHLKYDTRFHAFVFLSTILFVAIFFVLTFIDIRTRDLMNPSWGNEAFVRDQGAGPIVRGAHVPKDKEFPAIRPAPTGGHAEGAKSETGH